MLVCCRDQPRKLTLTRHWRSKGVDVVAYANQDLVYSDLAAGRLDAALQDEVAASEGFLKQPAGKDFAFAGPSVKDKNTSVTAPV